MSRIKVISLIFFFGISHSGFSQFSGEIISDRPGFTIGANTVGKNVLQFQQGILRKTETWEAIYSSPSGDFSGESELKNLVQANQIRFGIAERWELGGLISFANEEYSSVIKNSNDPALPNGETQFFSSNIQTYQIGARYSFVRNEKKKVGLAFQVLTGMERYALENRILVFIKTSPVLVFSKSFSDFQFVSVNLGAEFLDHNRTDFFFSGRYRHRIGRLTAQAEVRSIYLPSEVHSAPLKLSTSAGFFIPICTDFLWDTSVGFGNGSANVENSLFWSIATGISWRIHPY